MWLSAGPRTTTVPQLVGQTERTARFRMEQDGVELGSVTTKATLADAFALALQRTGRTVSNVQQPAAGGGR